MFRGEGDEEILGILEGELGCLDFGFLPDIRSEGFLVVT